MKRTATTILLAVLSLTLTAHTVTRQQARSVAAQFMSQRGICLSQEVPHRAVRYASDGQTSYYVFNATAGQGFVVVSGDSRTCAVLGYTDHGTFDVEHQPEGLRWLLQTYEEQIAAVANSELGTPDTMETARHPIAPLMHTLWNQGEPYNLLCPRYYEDDGTQGGLSATGCVATAISQVMCYYRYPSTTRRTIPGYLQSYDTKAGRKSIQLRNIPANSAIDWDNILDNYHGGETEAQQTAIAQLMYWVGLGCKMSYGSQSAAGFPEGIKALVNYFGYDDGTHVESRGNHTIRSWHELLYNELAGGHPVAFAGSNSGGAHAFVLDGYDAEGLFHVNWGWGGLDNGYFRLDVLAPDNNTGIGASPTPDGYNMGQDAIIGMRLPDDGKAEPLAYQLTVNDWEIRAGNVFFANYVNWSGVSTDWNMGLAYVNEEGRTIIVGSYRSAYLAVNTFVGQELPVRGLPEGRWRLVPVSKRSADRDWQLAGNPDIRYVLAVVDAQGGVQLEMHPIENIALEQMSFPGTHKRGERQMVTATLSNHGDEYFREIHLLASRSADKGESVCRTAVGILPDGRTTASFSFTPEESGLWNVWLATDSRGDHVVGQGTVEITDDGMAVNHNLRYIGHTVNNKVNGSVVGNCMQGKVSVFNQGTESYDGNLRLWLFKEGDGGFYGANSIYVPVSVDPGQRVQVPFCFDGLELGVHYAMSILYDEGGDIQDGGLKDMGRPQQGVVCWKQNGTLTAISPSTTINVPSDVVAVDMTALSMATMVRQNANPNTLYLLPDGASVPDGLDDANVVVGGVARNIRLTDGYAFLSPTTFVAREISYVRQGKAGRWETVALPFVPTQMPDGARMLTFSHTDRAGLVVFSSEQTVDYPVPFLIRTDDDAELTFSATDALVASNLQDTPSGGDNRGGIAVWTNGYRFYGTTFSQRLSGIFVLNDDATAFLPADGQVMVPPFRAYFTVTADVERIDLPKTTGIETVHRPEVIVQSSQSKVYDLQGRSIDSSKKRKGLYIQNHRIVVR